MTKFVPNDSSARPYPAVFVLKDGTYYLSIPDIGLTATGADLNAAAAILEARKKEYLETQIALGRAEHFAQPGATGGARDMTSFLVKTAAVACAIAFIVASSLISLEYVFRESLAKTALRSGQVVMWEAVQAMERLGAQPTPSADEERLRTALRTAVTKLRPYAAELRPLIEELSAKSQDVQ